MGGGERAASWKRGSQIDRVKDVGLRCERWRAEERLMRECRCEKFGIGAQCEGLFMIGKEDFFVRDKYQPREECLILNGRRVFFLIRE